MLVVFKSILQFLLRLDNMIFELKNNYENIINSTKFNINTLIYNTFDNEYYDECLIYFVDEDSFISIINNEVVYFDLLSQTIKKRTFKKYTNYILLEFDDNSLYDICLHNDNSYLILINDNYITNKINKLKNYAKYIDILSNQLIKLYQNYKKDIIQQLRNRDIVLNIGKNTNKIVHLDIKKYFTLLIDLKIKVEIDFNQYKNVEEKIFNELKKLELKTNDLLEYYYSKKLINYKSILTYKYSLDGSIDNFIVQLKFNYSNILDLILYSDFIDTIAKS